MRHKGIIIALAVLLCVLFGLKGFLRNKETTTYPLHLDFMEFYTKSSSDSDPIIQFAVRDRINNECANPLFFCKSGVTLGMPKEEFERMNIENNSICFGEMDIPAEVIYKFDKNNNLSSVGARFEMASFATADTYLMDFLGDRRLDITTDAVVHRIWYYKDSYFHFDYTQFGGDKYYYLKSSTYDDKGSHSLNELALYGGVFDHEFEDKNKTNASSASSRTYKYGDSDVYQGSSQQAADLAAIDAYFGF